MLTGKRIVCISDIHSSQEYMKYVIPKGTLLIFSGDASLKGTKEEVENFLAWFENLKFKYKIFCPGNHDFFFDTKWKAITEKGAKRHTHKVQSDKAVKKVLDKYPSIIYLNDSGVEIEGAKIWCSAITPWFNDWAFNRSRGEDIQKHWDLIPKDTNILITHGPAMGILDMTRRGEYVGCENLLTTIKTLKDLKLHVCGHIHENYGMIEDGGVKFINASICDVDLSPINKPFVVKI